MLILNKWWDNEKPDSAKEYKPTLLPKSNKERDNIGKWHQITISNNNYSYENFEERSGERFHVSSSCTWASQS